MATYLRTSALFELKNADNAVRFMVSSFATEGTEDMIVTLKHAVLGAIISPPEVQTGSKEIVGGTPVTLQVPACGVATLRWENLPAGIYELDLKFFDNELKPTADIRDGSVNTAPNYGRFYLSPDNFVRQILEGP